MVIFRLTQASHQNKGFELTFKNVVIKAQEKEILKKVSGLAHPGEMLAIMGPSGKSGMDVGFRRTMR